MKYILGIDIGGTNFRIGAVEQGEKKTNFLKESSGEKCILF